MRWLLLLVALFLVGCTEADAVRIGERDFRIEGPPVPGGSDAPNKRLSAQLCPGGYRVLTNQSHKGGLDRAIYDQNDTSTIWTIRCL